jgi:hypothetical protein
MANVTIGEICDAIESTLSAAVGINRTESYDELTEGINNADCPLLQVYWESFGMDPSGSTDRSSFGGRGGVENSPLRQKPIVIHVDLYASRRNHLAQNMKAVVDATDAILNVFEQQDVKPYFGLLDDGGGDAIKAWSLDDARRVIFQYGDGAGQVNYSGARFILTIHVY